MYRLKPLFLFALPTLLLIGSWMFAFASTARGQDEELFNTSAIERSVLTRFKLSNSDRRLIHAAIERENRVLVLSYFRLSETNTDFLSLWNKVRVERHEGEDGDNLAGFSMKQKMALRKAREALERRVLEMWLDDYVSGLTDLLELDRVQMDCVSKIFQRESDNRRRLLNRESTEGVLQGEEWNRITDERNQCLRAILDPIQLHDYYLLYTVTSLIA